MSAVNGPKTHGSINLIMSKEDYVNSMETYEFAYMWTIENFGQWAKPKIRSPSFSSNYSDANDEWLLRIEHSGHLWMRLQLQSFNNISHYLLKAECEISNKNNDILCTCNTHIFNQSPQIVMYEIPEISGCLQSDGLKVCCTITMSKKKMNNPSVISRLNATQQLSVDLKKLLSNEQLSDITIQVGQKSFPAIKGILAVRSPVFFAMFNHEQFKENQKNEVVIEDIDEDVFEEFLHFIYTGKSLNIDKMPMELLAVAEKYQVDYLKNVCEKIICGTINLNNVASLLVFSDRYNLEKLDEKCLGFIKKNLQSVLSSETFKVEKKKHSEFFLSVLEKLLLLEN